MGEEGRDKTIYDLTETAENYLKILFLVPYHISTLS
jgi:hypothetical protein